MHTNNTEFTPSRFTRATCKFVTAVAATISGVACGLMTGGDCAVQTLGNGAKKIGRATKQGYTQGRDVVRARAASVHSWLTKPEVAVETAGPVMPPPAPPAPAMA